MFSLFKKKEHSAKVVDRIYLHQQAKLDALLQIARQDAPVVFLCWFEETKQHLQQFFQRTGKETTVIISRYAKPHDVENKHVVFAEHYPLATKEQELFASLALPEVIIYSSLDEPFFVKFGGDKIIEMLNKLGMAENESIENKMITNAIKNAQEKIEAKVTMEQSAHSQADWIRRNLL